MEQVVASYSKRLLKSFVAIQVTSIGLTESEQKELREDITKAVAQIKKKRRHDKKPNLRFFNSFNLK